MGEFVRHIPRTTMIGLDTDMIAIGPVHALLSAHIETDKAAMKRAAEAI